MKKIAVLLISLIVIGAGFFSGCTSVEVDHKSPTVSIYAEPTTGYAPLSVQFNCIVDTVDGNISSFYWDFGDGGISYLQSITHVFTERGKSYNVVVTVTDSKGATANNTVIITTSAEIPNKKPAASAYAIPTNGDAPLQVSFYGTGNDTDGTIASYNWDFNDGTTSNQQNPIHTFTQIRTYMVLFTVTDDKGATATDTIVITVREPEKENTTHEENNVLPVAGFSYSYYSEYNYALQFLDESYDLDGYIVAQTFDFGDGTIGSGTAAPGQIFHEYSGVGTYTVTLTVEDNKGGINQKTVAIEITENIKPVAVLLAEPTSGQAPLTVEFSARNSYDPDGQITSYKWLYDDIINSSGGGGVQQQIELTFIKYDETFSNTYNYPGIFNVELVVYDNRGAVSNNVTVTITVT